LATSTARRSRAISSMYGAMSCTGRTSRRRSRRHRHVALGDRAPERLVVERGPVGESACRTCRISGGRERAASYGSTSRRTGTGWSYAARRFR
jgi:hypothetical protein